MTVLSKRDRYAGILGCVMMVGMPSTFAATNSGSFELTNKKFDHVITSYSIASGAKGLMTSVLLSNEKYQNEENLKMLLYRDDDWVNVKKATTCEEKTKYARQTVSVRFEQENKDQTRQWGYRKPRWRSETHLKIEPVEVESSDYTPRHHYWYIVMADCSLDSEYTATIPKIQYYLQIYNMISEKAITHLSTDEFSLSRIHTFTMFFSCAIALFLFGKISYDLSTSGIVHIAKLMVWWATACDVASSAFELLHMYFYRLDGIGWFFLDDMSAYAEAICDGLICFLLLAIAAGWTLPSDVISIKQGQDNATVLQKIFVGLANPTGSESWLNIFSVFFFGSIVTHLALAHWGLTYNADYDSYHDLEHIPGKVLMVLRSVLGIFMFAATVQTRIKCKASLESFYTQFAIVGTIWFQGLPCITWMCNTLVAFHRRHPTVVVASAGLQSMSLLLLSWLVAANEASSYHKVSHMTQTGENNLTEKIASVRSGKAVTWRLVGKSKVRLD
jgi:Rhodopsin-like GPCR transmembrane domain